MFLRSFWTEGIIIVSISEFYFGRASLELAHRTGALSFSILNSSISGGIAGKFRGLSRLVFSCV